MPTLYIEEYADLLEAKDGKVIQATDNLIGNTQLTIAGASVVTPVDFDPDTKLLVLVSDTNCQYEIGDGSAVATAASRFLPAGVYRPIAVEDATRIAVIEQQ